MQTWLYLDWCKDGAVFVSDITEYSDWVCVPLRAEVGSGDDEQGPLQIRMKAVCPAQLNSKRPVGKVEGGMVLRKELESKQKGTESGTKGPEKHGPSAISDVPSHIMRASLFRSFLPSTWGSRSSQLGSILFPFP